MSIHGEKKRAGRAEFETSTFRLAIALRHGSTLFRQSSRSFINQALTRLKVRTYFLASSLIGLSTILLGLG